MAEKIPEHKISHLEKRRLEIKETARKMIIERGLKSVTMKDIALSCGIGRKTLYRFYPNIEALAQEILCDMASSNDSFTNTYRIEGVDMVEKLRNAARAYVGYCNEQQDRMMFYYEYDYYFRKPGRELIHDYWRAKPNSFFTILEKGISRGSLGFNAEQAYKISLTIPLAIIALAQRILPRAEVYRIEYGYEMEDIYQLADLLVLGIIRK